MRRFIVFAILSFSILNTGGAGILSAADGKAPKTGNDLEAADVGATDLGKNHLVAGQDGRLAWWRNARFGCFVHWGVYSQLGNEWRGRKGGGYAEHIQRILKISMADYKADAIDKFNPTNFDANAWIALIKKTGMGYFIITAKHHDGFAMYDSKVSDYNIVKQGPWKHDPMKDLKAVCDREGIHFGFYYSHAFDWGDPFAPGNDWDWKNPGGDLLLCGKDWFDHDAKQLESVRKNFVDRKTIPQLQELLAGYHPDILWFDTPSKLPLSENRRILAAVRKADPRVLINGRLVRGEGDYLSTGDRAVEFRKLDDDWETIPTTNESYGWSPLDFQYKTPEFLIRVLAKAVSRGGNLLLNIGPTRDGSIDPHDIAILDGIGKWMAVNGEAIHGCNASPLPPQAWGVVTSKAKRLYLHVFDWPAQSLMVGGLLSNPLQAALITPKGRVPLQYGRINDQDLVVTLPPNSIHPADSVIVLEFSGVPKGGGVRLLSDQVPVNQLLAFDAELHGRGKTGEASGLGYRDGKMNNYCVDNWTRPDQWLSWEVRVNKTTHFDVSLNYGKCGGGEYEVRCGGWTSGPINASTNGQDAVIAEAHVDQLGSLALSAGIHTIELRVTRVKQGEVFRPLDLWLKPGHVSTDVPSSGHQAPYAPFRHPVLERWNKPAANANKESNKESRGVKELMALTDDQVRALIPDQPPTISDLCPVCARKKAPGSIMQSVKPFPVEFDPIHPDHITCEKCGTVFPNAGFPLKKQTMQNMLGEEVTVEYYCDEHITRTIKEKVAGKPHLLYLRGLVDNARNAWLMPRLNALADLYLSTHEERHAKRLILVLDEYARRYPHYLLTTDYGLRYVTTKGQRPPYGFVDTRWDRRAADDLPQSLLALFDLAASSPSMDAVVKQRIIDGLFMDPLKRAELRDSKAEDPYYGNECPLKAIAERALVLEDPDRVHLAYNLIRNVPHYATSVDAVFNQSLGYGSLFRLTFFEGAHVLDGYSDPPGYVGKDGRHLENIHPMKEMEAYFHRLATDYDKLRLPSGGWLTYDDSGSGFGPTWWSGVGNETCRPLAQSGNVMLPGLRRAVLGAGSGDKQIQVALDFAEHGVNHGHQSGLAMQIYAYGHSLVDDFPYHKSVLRAYGSQTVSHPTVVINCRNQEGRHTAGDVELYAPLMDGVAAIRVDDTRAYDGLATKYVRSLVLNSIDPDLPYVVDIFEVTGGVTHDYMVRSSGQHHSSGSSTLTMQPLPGERPLLPPGEKWVDPKLWGQSIGSGYGLFFDAGKAPVIGPFNFTSVCDQPWDMITLGQDQEKSGKIGAYLAGPDSWPDRPTIGIRHHVAVNAGYEFINATSPSLVEMGFHGKEDVPTEQWPRIPHRIIRHSVKEGGSSLFVVVHEPYHHAPKITSVVRLDQGDDHLLALRIGSPGRVDTLLYSLDRSRLVSAGGVTMSGRLGLVSRQDKQPPRAYLMEGTQLNAEGVGLKNSTAAYAGSVTAAERCWESKGVSHLRDCL